MILPKWKRGALETPDGAILPYVIVGSGPIPVVVLPGAGDGLSLVTDAAMALAWFYRQRASQHRLLILSRRQPIPPDYSIAQHADDMLWAVERLGWGPAVWECNSAGGPIGQQAAVKRPDLVRGLIVSSTLHRTGDHSRAVFEYWLDLITNGRWSDLTWSALELTFRPSKVRLYRLVKPFLPYVVRPSKYPHRLGRILVGLLGLDQRDLLQEITCPALVIGGLEDRIIPAQVQAEMAELLPNSQLELAAGYGHGNDLENPAYRQHAVAFIRSVMEQG